MNNDMDPPVLPAVRRPPCAYCGNTGTVNGARCPVCNGG